MTQDPPAIKKEAIHVALPPSKARPRPPPRRPTRSLNLSISLLILGFVVLWSQRQSLSPRRSFSLGGTRPPSSYVLCTHGRAVHTAPEKGGVGSRECLVVRGKEIVDSGSLASMRRIYRGDDSEEQHFFSTRKKTPIYRLPAGFSVTPGLIDAHAHTLMYGYYEQLSLRGSSSIEEVVQRVEDFVRKNGISDGAWIEGMGWNQNLWAGKQFPATADLERSPILRGLPISLARIDVHAEWVSQAVLDMMGPLPDHVDGGQIVRDAEGRPTGVFLDNAIDLIKAVKPKWTDSQRATFLDRATRDVLSKGMTGIHDAQVVKDDYDFYLKMAHSGKLGVRFYLMASCADPSVYCGDDFEQIDQASDGRLTVKAVKLFADGALGSRGAALIKDYADQPGWKGFLLQPEETWKPLVKEWYDNGWQVNVHAIGDLANKVVVDAIEAAIGSDRQKGAERRLRIEHAQIMRPDDIKRAVDLGVIGSYQPTHATSDMWYAEDRLGEERLKGAYAWQTYTSLGGRIALGSDFPVESIDPLKGFYAAVTRLSEDGTSPHGPGGWVAQERLTREQALRGFTIDAAYAGFSNTTGSLTPGRRFDAVIWDDDLMTVEQDEMLQTQVKATIIDGEIVFGKFEVERL